MRSILIFRDLIKCIDVLLSITPKKFNISEKIFVLQRLAMSAQHKPMHQVGNPLALLKGSLGTPKQSPVPKRLKDFYHVFEL